MHSASTIEKISEITEVHLPVEQDVFARRAARFRSIAPGNVLGDYLSALAALADAQQSGLNEIRSAPRKDLLKDGYPLHVAQWRRDDAWRFALKIILTKMETAPLPTQAHAALKRLSACTVAELEASADALLTSNFERLDLSSAPFLGAALQVYWTALAGTIAIPGEAPLRYECPVCASPPVAGVVMGDSKLRYLACRLCTTQWHLPRLICSNCGCTQGLYYLGIESAANGVKAECCPQCHAYLKLFYLESVPGADPFADDVATLALDILVSEEGFSRISPNYYLASRNGSAENEF
jgi:FdhE protein